MRSSSSLSLRALLSVLSVVAVGLLSPGCRRAAKPDMGLERTVEAGVPAEFGSAQEGAPSVSWDFGDGSAAQTGARVSHAFARGGTYTVRALDGSEEVGRVQLTVVPRPVLRAIPADAAFAAYIPQLRGGVEPMLALMGRLFGPDLVQRELAKEPMLQLAVESVRGSSQAVDAEEGFGLFSLPDFDGVVAMLGVADGPAVMAAVLKDFEADGKRVQPGAEGSARVESITGEEMLVFLDRGYLYLAMPDAETAPGEPVQAQATVAMTAEAVRGHIAGFTGPGLSESEVLTRLRGRVQEGSLYFYTAAPKQVTAERLPVSLSSLRVKEDRVELDGFTDFDKPLPELKPGPVPALLEKAPMGPVVAGMLSVHPGEVASRLLGEPGSPKRAEVLAKWSQEGVDAEALLGSLRGDVTLLVYFDAPAFYRNFITNKRPEPRGSVLLEAGLSRPEPVLAALTKTLTGSTWTQEKAKGVTRFRTRMMDQPVVFTVSADRLSLEAGEALEARPRGDVGGALRQRFGASAFGPSHLSVMVDAGRLRAELDAPEQVPGVPAAQLGAAKALGGAFLDQLPPVDHAFMDLSLEEGGLRVRGRVVVRTN
ncbi:PKD domain-containing protein [Hyalangium rubrum]|uniref:PKD domain-containing protein n=1 Tax=Hyalangium rubrum TaxID=3103134 RepID=A0ABU5GZT0_9BACT|nr:PKD domain-containing protein [Hyalangium sp. s54d21]MDY7225355.1 PKD domain-containing protein [Hyalangium sp. s54d21]